MRRALALGAGLLTLAAVWASEGRWVSPWIPLAVGSVIASGTWSGIALGVLACTMSALVLAAPEWTLLGSLGLVSGGVALGVLAREVEKNAAWALTQGAARSGVWLSGGLLGLCALPDARLLLLDAAGSPLELTARLQDPAAGVAGLVHLPAVMESPTPGQEVLLGAGVVALFAAFLLIRRQVTEPDHEERFAWKALGLAGALVALAGVWGVAQLVSGTVSVPDAEVWALALSKAGQGTAVTGVELPHDARLGLASRPLIDPLRAVAGILVCAWALGPWKGKTVARVSGPRPGVLLAIAFACLAALFVSNTVSWVLVGGALVAFFSVLVAQRHAPSSRLGEELLALVMISWLAGWLSPAWTGTFA